MTSADIRQSFLDFFKSRQHTLVPSSSLMPDSPNLLFTNAGMNQFVPIFLGQVKCPYNPGRAADTQKCIRAGGKHNDLEDVGLDTYHHTFFEMLGNWSFGDYFKAEAIPWAWELITEVWKFPKNRLYATVYCPDKTKGDPADFDQDAYDQWARLFTAAGLDPKQHILNGGKKDNFWMMGDTGPCGPCSELHVDLTPNADTRGALVNQGDPRCIEIWNLVFIQFNANPDGTYSPLPARHVDTGMGFERVTGIIQNTKGFTDFTRTISNYETDIFRPLFDKLEALSGKKYRSTLPERPNPALGNPESEPKSAKSELTSGKSDITPGESDITPGESDITPGESDITSGKSDITSGKSHITSGESHITSGESDITNGESDITNGESDITPGESDITNGKSEFTKATNESTIADFRPGFQGSLPRNQANEEAVDIAFRVIADHIRTLSFAIADGIQPGNTDRNYVLRRILRRAVRYGRTLGFHEPFFYKLVSVLADTMGDVFPELRAKQDHIEQVIQREEEAFNKTLDRGLALFEEEVVRAPEISGAFAFRLYDEQGFPLDLTELMARERGLTVDVAGFNKLMDEQKARARAAQKKQVIELSQVETTAPTRFVGYDNLEAPAKVLEVVAVKDKTAVILDTSPFYAEMGGQVGDTGELQHGSQLWRITNTQKAGDAWLHFLEVGHLPSAIGNSPDAPAPGSTVAVAVDRPRRSAIQRHHTVTHLLHWALHEVVSPDATQKGSYVGPEKLTFDFSSAPLTPQQVADVERLVNERILENAPVTWAEANYADVKSRKDIMQFFGDKYGDVVRVVQIGDYSMELCGGTHTRATGEIGLFRIAAESAIAAGIRRIEAVSGLEAYRRANEELQLIKAVAGKVNAPIGELEKKIESLLAQQKDLEKQLKAVQQKQAADLARSLAAKAQTIGATPAILENLGAADGDFLQAVADALKGQFKGVVVLGGVANSAVALVASVSPDFTKQVQAGKIIQAIAPIVGGKGGGRPDNARGGGKDVTRLDEALAKAKSLLA